MHLHWPTRSLARLLHGLPAAGFLAVLLTAAVLLSGCQKTPPPQVSPVEAEAASAAAPSAPAMPSETPAPTGPTATSKSLPATWTPQPPTVLRSPSPAPSRTATPHFMNTISAATATWQATTCEKYPDVWQIETRRSWRTGWCDLQSRRFTLYEYTLSYPSAWKVNLFGGIYPNMIFVTGQPKVELRLYQAYSYDARSYSGSLQDAPEKAAFCDPSEKCLLVVDPNEQLGQREIRTIGAKEVLVLDSQDGKYNVRRYFFRMLFTSYKPLVNRLFIVKLYTPTQIGAVTSAEITTEEDAQYHELLEQIEHMIGTIQQDTDRRLVDQGCAAVQHSPVLFSLAVPQPQI